jgi:hypothetical protein
MDYVMATSDAADESTEEIVVCEYCNNTTFTVYITSIIDDARLYCNNCGRASRSFYTVGDIKKALKR